MKENFPKKIFIREEGPREGFQIHPEFIPTAQKLKLIKSLSETGVKSIETTSFVRSDRVPGLADAKEVAEGLDTSTGVRYRALCLNQKGFLRAIECKKLKLEGSIPLAASGDFLKKNANISLDDSIEEIPGWLKLFSENKIAFERIMLSMAWGSKFDGNLKAEEVISVIDKINTKVLNAGASIPEITLADTTGFATPLSLRKLVLAVNEKYPDIIVALHLHDTRGTGMANVYEGLRCGVERFDTSVAGLGGCPFTPGAAGNVATEDVVYLCHELGVETGIDLEKYIESAKLAEEIIGSKLPGKVKDNY